MNDDMALLQEYAKSGSENSFATLVNRHVDFVYSAALRQTGNPHLAEEITQVVFIILARKAGSISKSTILAGWLFRTTRFAANDALKKEIRRQRREQEAAQMEPTSQESEMEQHWQQVSPLLDDALAQLAEKERSALLLRFFEKKNFKEVGLALGTNEDAAKKRVSRAIDKLRNLFMKRGTVFPATVLIGVISANSVSAAPAGLASSIAAGAIAKGTVAGASTLTLIKGTLEIMAWTKAKTVAAVAAAVIIGGGTTAIVVEEIVLPAVQSGSFDESLWSINSANLDRLPRIVLIRPTRFPKGGGLVMNGDGRTFGQNADVQTLVFTAYNSRSTRTIFPPGLPEAVTKQRFDFLMNLPTGNSTAFRAELKKQFGVTARREIREVDALVLKVKNAGAPGLKVSTEGLGSSESGNGKFAMKRKPISTLAEQLESLLKITIIDQTGLTGNYDVEFSWSNSNTSAERVSLTKAMVEQLGLELVPSRERIEMLIVETERN